MNKVKPIHPLSQKESFDLAKIKDRKKMVELTSGIDKMFIKKHFVVPLYVESGKIYVGALKYQIKIFHELQLYFDKPLVYVPLTHLEIKECLNEVFPEHQLQTKKLQSEDFFAHLIEEAIHQRASDIHIEPNEGGFVIRFRVDGVMQEVDSGDETLFQRIVSHIKILAKLDIAEHRLPQDGRIRMHLKDRLIDLRISSLPVYGGQRVVLRILDQSGLMLNLASLQLGTIETRFQTMIKKHEGLLLVTGPTGSGKTTTLYSVLDHLNSSSLNIMTIEDPIEYRIEGISQLGVRPKIDLDFAKGLRHILRQDPDVILIGEIRDKETAQIAIQASLTGHLVLATLHTNDAPSAIIRLVEMGIEKYLVSSSLIGVLSQRLVRLICPNCKTQTNLTEEQRSALNLNVTLAWEGKGCSKCFQTGYNKRRGIFEWLEMNDTIREMMLHDLNSNALKAEAQKEGMVSLKSHGSELVRKGITSPFEVLRVLG